MRDISRKFSTLRTAIAEATVYMLPETIVMIREGKLPKGDPFAVAKVAAIQAAKNTSQLIPYCHPMPIDFAGATFTIASDHILVRTEVKAVWKTGVEMEALTAASVAALTIYDMTKMVDESVVIREIRLLSKNGGKSDFHSISRKLRAAVLVLSDAVSAGSSTDTSGKRIKDRLIAEGLEVADYAVLPDEKERISERLRYYADEMKVDLVLTTGGTGLGPRDVTPEAMQEVIDRSLTGITEAMRNYGQERTPFAMLSRGLAGQRGNTIIVNLPGSERAVEESLDALFPHLFHAFKMIAGDGHEMNARFAEMKSARP